MKRVTTPWYIIIEKNKNVSIEIVPLNVLLYRLLFRMLSWTGCPNTSHILMNSNTCCILKYLLFYLVYKLTFSLLRKPSMLHIYNIYIYNGIILKNQWGHWLDPLHYFEHQKHHQFGYMAWMDAMLFASRTAFEESPLPRGALWMLPALNEYWANILNIIPLYFF